MDEIEIGFLYVLMKSGKETKNSSHVIYLPRLPDSKLLRLHLIRFILYVCESERVFSMIA